MAGAPGHRLGQIIGDMLELAVEPPLSAFCKHHDLYLDGKRPRRARSGVKVTWEDDLGNKHDLDHVIERGGTEDVQGIPAGFIETAWRRYTKHSKAKAQEMQAAVLPVLAKWSHVKPFCGVILAGEFTSSSLKQLESNGFAVLHIPYGTIIEVFKTFDIDVLYDETTPDRDLQAAIDRYEALSPADKLAIGQSLRQAAETEIAEFIAAVSAAILRRIASVSILALHGSPTSKSTARAAQQLLSDYQPPTASDPLVRFEVIIRYDNGDEIVADFQNADDAITFLGTFD